MIQVLTTKSEHSITFIGRYVPTIECFLSLYNEVTKVETNVLNTFSTINGITTVTFTFTFLENDKYQIKISDDDGIIYRGKIIATVQTAQEFKQTKDLYYYE
jgi:hypothetical protein